MTSAQLNPPPSSFPAVELNEEQLQLFLSPHQASASLSSGPTNFFSSTSPRFQTARGEVAGSHDHHHHQVDEYTTLISRSNGHIKLLSTSSTEAETSHVHKFCKREEQCRDQLEGSSSEGSIKWMQSNMRLNCSSNCSETVKPVRFTVRFPDHHQDHSKECNSSSNSNAIRVCSDCNTTTTPLWRSGPRGPKSLCNACGIRQRKARRTMAAAAAAAAAASANGSVGATEASSMKTKVHNKERKSRSSNIAQCKKIFNKHLDHPPASSQTQKKICFKNFALSLSKNSPLQQVFPRDVEEAAFLLMELSCGFIHS